MIEYLDTEGQYPNNRVIKIFAGGPLRAPAITRAEFRKDGPELAIFGTDFTGAARVEVNGVLLDREPVFDPDRRRLTLEGKRRDLNLKSGRNHLVVVRKGMRSNTLKLRLE